MGSYNKEWIGRRSPLYLHYILHILCVLCIRFFGLNVYDQNNYQNILIQKWTQTWLKRFIAITVSSVCPELTELCHQMSKTRTRINVRVVWMGWRLCFLYSQCFPALLGLWSASALPLRWSINWALYDSTIYCHRFTTFLQFLIPISLKRFKKLVECQRRVKCQTWVLSASYVWSQICPSLNERHCCWTERCWEASKGLVLGAEQAKANCR